MTKERLNYRVAAEADIPKIVNLLKLSLGESLMPKSEAYWRWKHIDNPFGPSPVLLAEDRNKIVGVRAFMRWEWKKGNEVIKAVRAVDTATHPDYQGRGIFKKLTQDLIEECKDQKLDLVFNTPNEKSKSGYLKMGWEEAGRLSVCFRFKKPFSMILSIIGKNNNNFLQLADHSFRSINKVDTIIDKQWRTNYSYAYIKWRYSLIPIIEYYSRRNDLASIIYRLKSTRKGVELRICDVFGKKDAAKQLISELIKETDCHYVTLSGFYGKIMPGIFRYSAYVGPQTTVRAVNRKVDDFIGFRNWSPALGDMEVF